MTDPKDPHPANRTAVYSGITKYTAARIRISRRHGQSLPVGYSIRISM